MKIICFFLFFAERSLVIGETPKSLAEHVLLVTRVYRAILLCIDYLGKCGAFSVELAWNTQKNQMSDVKGKEMEQERKGKISNEDIDLERTHLNIELVESDLNLYQRVKERVDDLKESGSRVQKNSVVMYSNILTVPVEQAERWGEEKTDEYFKSCYDFFCEEFGKENVVSAKIHKDETSPHMHLHFVPVNKENGRLQARVAMNRAKMNYIHDHLPKFLQKRNFDVVRGSGKKEPNIEDIHEYKAVQRLKAELKSEKNKLESQKKEIGKSLKNIKTYTSPLAKIEEIEKRKFVKGLINKRIELSVDDYENLSAMGKENLKLRQKIIELKSENYTYQQKNDKLTEENVSFRQNINYFSSKVSKLDSQVLQQEKQIKELRKDLAVYSDIVVNDLGITHISEKERNARVVLSGVEKGRETKDKNTAIAWNEILEDGRGTNINPTRLENGIDKVKDMLNRILEHVKDLGTRMRR